MQPDVTKRWTVGKVTVQILEQADGTSKAWFAPVGPTTNYAYTENAQGAETTADELRQMAEALLEAAEHIEPTPNTGVAFADPVAEYRLELSRLESDNKKLRARLNGFGLLIEDGAWVRLERVIAELQRLKEGVRHQWNEDNPF